MRPDKELRFVLSRGAIDIQLREAAAASCSNTTRLYSNRRVAPQLPVAPAFQGVDVRIRGKSRSTNRNSGKDECTGIGES